jgi:hypothetical protein
MTKTQRAGISLQEFAAISIAQWDRYNLGECELEGGDWTIVYKKWVESGVPDNNGWGGIPFQVPDFTGANQAGCRFELKRVARNLEIQINNPHIGRNSRNLEKIKAIYDNIIKAMDLIDGRY